MEETKLYIGSHCSMNGPDYFLGTVREAISYGSTTFMFYTGAPQNSFRVPLDKLKINEAKALLKENGFNLDKLVCHAPYIINPSNPNNSSLREQSVEILINEMRRCYAMGCKTLVLHPGNHLKDTPESAIKCLIESLTTIFDNDKTDVKIALETMSGKGSEIGRDFHQLRQIIDGVQSTRLGVCLDTCHISDAGYDVNNFDTVLDEFDSVVGLDRLLVVHLNDSKNPRGSHKDRHENIGYGYIGFEALYKVVHNERLESVPKILETPYFNDVPMFKKEIEMLRNGKYIDNWREN